MSARGEFHVARSEFHVDISWHDSHSFIHYISLSIHLAMLGTQPNLVQIFSISFPQPQLPRTSAPPMLLNFASGNILSSWANKRVRGHKSHNDPPNVCGSVFRGSNFRVHLVVEKIMRL